MSWLEGDMTRVSNEAALRHCKAADRFRATPSSREAPLFQMLRAAIGILLTSPTLLASDGWMTDYDQALTKARESKKDLLLLFTQSDSPVCKQLESELYAQEAFISAVEKDYVLVRLDFQEDGSVAVPGASTNRGLRKLHGVAEYPVTVQATPAGHAYWVSSARMKYEGPTDCAEWVAEWRSMGKPVLGKMLELVSMYEKTDEASRWAAWDKLAVESEEAVWPWQARVLAPAIRSAIELDMDNKLGKKRRALEVLIKTKCVDDSTKAMAERLDPKNELGLLELVLVDKNSALGASLEAQRQSIASEEQILALAAALIAEQEAALKELDAFVKAFGFRDDALQFQCYWKIAFLGHLGAKMFSMAGTSGSGNGVRGEKARQELDKSAKKMIATGKDAARKAKKLGRHREPTPILDKLLDS
ncbi:MAG: thioredoxin family protein [Planctomycetes bacterium]|nr:thioredoxin family protein [Planctomycetota bacterium]